MKQLCIVLALAVTGCSFVLTSGPSDETPRRSYPSCTQSMAWPIVDGVFSAIFLLSMSTAIASDDEMPSDPGNESDSATRAETITSTAVLAAITGVSAYVGYRRVSRCRGARESFLQNSPQPYGTYGYPPTPYPPQYAPQPYPNQQPSPYPPAPQPAPNPQPASTAPQPVPTALGTEGDVCAQTSECATGLLCTSNVCMRPPSK